MLVSVLGEKMAAFGSHISSYSCNKGGEHSGRTSPPQTVISSGGWCQGGLGVDFSHCVNEGSFDDI